MLPAGFVYVAVVLNVLGSGSYILAVIRGRAQPNRVTWLLWGIVPLIALLAQRQAGVGLQSLHTLVAGALPLFVFASTYFSQTGYWHLGKFDYFCGCIAGIGALLWWCSSDAVYGIGASLLADAAASLPTIVKAYQYPDSENAATYLLAFLSAGIVLLTVQGFSIYRIAFPAYLLVLAGLLFTLSIRARWKG